MAAAVILAIGTTAATSADVTVAAGTPLTVGLNDAGGKRVNFGAAVEIQVKDNNGEYFLVDTLKGLGKPQVVIYGPGTYRFVRFAGKSCGVFSA